jgi:hypothetical protein
MGTKEKAVMSALGQTEKYSARADIFRSSSNNGRWFSARKGVTQIDGVGAFDRVSRIIVMEFRAARGNDRRGFKVLIPVGGRRLLLSRGSNRRGFRRRSGDEATLQTKASGIQQIGESRLDDFP